MSRLIRHAEAITRPREERLVDVALVNSLYDLLARDRRRIVVRVYRVQSLDGRLHVLRTAWNVGRAVFSGEQEIEKPSASLIEALQTQSAARELRDDDKGRLHVYHLPVLYDGQVLGVIELTSSRALSAQESILAEGMRGLYGNYLSLLQVSQVDALTRLLNRRTFDESLRHLLASSVEATPPSEGNVERREMQSTDNWLAVIDIDRFKQVNDVYGHVFGDEVLILIADIMRRVFRRRDKLFRFGGEEFVVLLRHAPEIGAQRVFERFRAAVAEREFPQVGKVTVSIGYTRVNPADHPTVLLGRADEALYYAKMHGRNQVRQHEILLAEGKIPLKRVNTEAEFF